MCYIVNERERKTLKERKPMSETKKTTLKIRLRGTVEPKSFSDSAGSTVTSEPILVEVETEMKRETKTQAGAKATIEPIILRPNGIVTPMMKIVIQHPKAGEIIVLSNQWAEKGGVEGAKDMYENRCVTIPQADFDAVMKEAGCLAEEAEQAEKKADEETRQKVLNECPADHVIARRKWVNGNSCMGCYVTKDGTEVIASDLLENHSGWYFIPASEVETKREEIARKNEKQQQRKEEKRESEMAAIAQAQKNNEPVEISRWTEPCCDSDEECSTDICIRYAMPDGSFSVRSNHTW